MVRHFFAAITQNVISLIGVLLAVVSLLLILCLVVVQLLGFEGGPYLGILTYLLLPAGFVLGLLLVPFGLWLQHRREKRKAGAAGKPLPVFDLNNEKTRGQIAVFTVLTLVAAVVVAGATYKGVEVMESTEFCGQACHTVMQPEATAHARSPHSKVACAQCHIGPGADWFVKSKISGAWQLVAVAFDLYPTPIPTPVHNLRPARDTCENCHSPTRFTGDRLKIRTHYADDEANTQLSTVLNVHVGGQHGKAASGIHWHVGEGVHVRYLTNEQRDKVWDVELTQPDGSKQMFKAEEAAPAGAQWREMDCVDCHNRPTHIYRDPEHELNLALDQGRIDQGLPFVKREGLRLLKVAYPSHEAARAGLQEELTKFYQQNYPQVMAEKAVLVQQAGKALGDIYSWNVFPQMKVTWGTYPNHLGHQDSPGCFRCHDNKHVAKTAEGGEAKISKKCTTCHNVVAEGEADPEILKALR
jgi:nitrate/TMAO reductase-like tetraheme cytochrome c subunit